MCSRGLMSEEFISILQFLSHRWNVARLSWLMFRHSLVISVRTFTARTRYVMYTSSNHSYSLRIPMIKRLRRKRLLCRINFQDDASLNTKILASSNRGSTVIYPSYPHTLHLIPPLTSIQQHHSIIFYRVWLLGIVFDIP